MKTFNEQFELNEFSQFLQIASDDVPAPLSQRIRSQAHGSLKQLRLLVFLKLLGIHMTMSFLSLLVCHQFDMNPFGTSFSLSDYFMQYGHSACMFFCGFLFLSGSLLIARLTFSTSDFSIIRRSFWPQIFVLSSLSLGVFMAFGAHIPLGMGLLWLAGAFIGAALPTLAKKSAIA